MGYQIIGKHLDGLAAARDCLIVSAREMEILARFRLITRERIQLVSK